MKKELKKIGQYILYGCDNCKYGRRLGGAGDSIRALKERLCGDDCRGDKKKYPLFVIIDDIKFKRNNDEWKYINFELHPSMQEEIDKIYFIKKDEFMI